MNYSKFGIEDFLSDISFQEYCLGNNEQAVAFWTEWLIDHPEKASTIHSAKALYYVLNGNITDENFRADYEIFQKAFGQLSFNPVPHLPSEQKVIPLKRSNVNLVMVLTGIAACFLIVFAVYLFKVKKSKESITNGALSFSSPLGKKKSIILTDGTKIILNGGSKLTVAGNYNISQRDVILEGEGYFDVIHNAQKPFTVHTAKINIKDIGTIFNVKAYATDKTTEASLIKGAVEITLNNKTKSKILLNPNHKLVLLNNKDLNIAEGKKTVKELFIVRKVTKNTDGNSVVETDWTQNKLTFSDQPFDEIAVQMERWYGVKIDIINPDVRAYHFTATFDHEDITQVLEALKLSGNFKYRKEDNVISIY
ncbi:FecR family protein [Mucilaginibacter sp. SP1R1]|uniref:FecR family protein n=1 Tax=Mucilaginibacter sp. SP1R1 TaxID=2723091 RepID=UPI0016163124|nr:FecR family protein [Mucilaginibacter sp. SP1R1]MBB6148155.1 ferric-dicitrate binding protein FerR (iron transport regulator) [Mucilaginibacter sp. SP1R1]